jgi:nicotinamide-nucleotide adenylyltransferase
MKRCLFVGRFQPFHNGHVEVIKKITKEVDELIIVIGSPQHSHELENPFTVGERISMIRLALDEMGVDPRKYYVIPVPDAQMHATWVSTVTAFTPSFEVVYSNEPLTRRLFNEAGFRVENIPFYHRETYSATEIRKRILNEQNWEELVPKSLARLIKEINGVERIRDLAKRDEA